MRLFSNFILANSNVVLLLDQSRHFSAAQPRRSDSDENAIRPNALLQDDDQTSVKIPPSLPGLHLIVLRGGFLEEREFCYGKRSFAVLTIFGLLFFYCLTFDAVVLKTLFLLSCKYR